MPHGGGGGRADAWRAINGSVREKDARVSSSFFFFARNRACHAGTQSSEAFSRLDQIKGREAK